MNSPAPDRVFDGGGHEQPAGYACAVRRGNSITVSGTTANDGDGGVAPRRHRRADDRRPASGAGLPSNASAGGSTTSCARIFLAPRADWRAASTAHAELLGDVSPANSDVFVHGLIGEAFLVEVEVDAVVLEPHGPW